MRGNRLVKILALALAVLMVTSGVSVAFAAESAYQTGYASKQEAISAGGELNQIIAEEGMVLLKNKDNVLPLKPGKVTVLGHAAISGGDAGSAANDTSAGVTKLQSDIYSSILAAGYEVNPTVEAQYRDWVAAEKTSDFAMRADFAAAKDGFATSISEYGDAAIVVLSGTGAFTTVPLMGGQMYVKTSEGKAMNPEAVPEGDTAERAHSMMLDVSQFELLKYANENFEKVVVVIANSAPIELGFLQDDATYPNVKAAILAGAPGANGFTALGKILSGEVNPSGRLVDMYVKDFTTNPSWVNWGDNGLPFDFGPAGMDGSYTIAPITAGGSGYIDAEGKARAAMFTDYEEGIYLGYRYYETRGFDEKEANAASTWYEDHVAYPFGYGLSYTTFDWEVVGGTADGTAIAAKDQITLEVKVTNKGDVAGKEVVEAYVTAPYTAGGIEKSHVVLADYAKTQLLQPGESETVTLTFMAIDMASYDWNDANKNDFKGYELEKGDYQVKVMRNSHDVVAAITCTVTEDIKCDASAVTGNTVENRFDYVNDAIASSADKTVLSRADWEGTWPKVPEINAEDPTKDGRYVSDEDFANWTLTVSAETDATAPWKAEAMPTVADAATRPEKAAVTLKEMVGKEYDDPQWDALLDQLTLQEMTDMINNGGFNTIEIPYIEKPFALDTDGPKGWTGNGVGGERTINFASAPVLASTWSKELAYAMGVNIGEQALWGNSDMGEGIKTYSGWYSPAMNTHRTPLDSRYTEYYSEDGRLAGEFAASVIRGARSKGVYVTVKHFAMHEDGSLPYRGMLGGFMGMEAGAGAETSGLSIWCNEQAMRELYFKPFQIAVEKSDPRGAMSSFSRIGYRWAGANYGLLTDILRKEWGFKGFVITDIEIYPFMTADAMIRAGGDLVLSAGKAEPRQVTASAGDEATHLMAIRQATKNILYAVANSNAMQLPIGAAMVYEPVTIEAAKLNEQYAAEAGGATLNTVTALTPMAYAISSGELPAGLTLDALTGTISGTPTAAGEFAFEITVAAEGYLPATQTFVLTVK